MYFRTALFWFLICGTTIGVIGQSTPAHSAKNKWLDTEGLYYLDNKQNLNDLWALIITRYGRPVPAKENDPDAPTKPGLHILDQHFKFITYTVTKNQVSFETEKINGRSFRFHGRVHRVTDADFTNLPALYGQLVETNGSTLKIKKVRFGRAVIY